MNCCSACFADSVLAVVIQTLGKAGECDFCDGAGVHVVPTSRLADYFGPLVALYVRDNKGESLHRLLQSDWQIFSAESDEVQRALTLDVISELGVEDGLFSVGYDPIDHGASWEAFAAELKYRNRFLPDTAPEASVFEAFVEQLGIIFPAGGQPLYRARISEDDHQFTPAEMLKPPADAVTNGRANPLGIPYLYVASDPDTAIAEVRGHKGDRVTVVEFQVVEELDLYDLRRPRTTVSPFKQLDDIQFIHEYLPYFELLGHELSRPITPRRANLDYLPSQYLCELIKKSGYHGILYGSSIAGGSNIVLFADERVATAGAMREYRIVEMNYKAEVIV